MVLNFGGVEKFQGSKFLACVHTISHGLSMYLVYILFHMVYLCNGTGSKPVRATGYGKSGHISNPALRIKVLAKLQTAEVVNKSTQKNRTNADFPRTNAALARGRREAATGRDERRLRRE